jgi:hypothetical protein
MGWCDVPHPFANILHYRLGAPAQVEPSRRNKLD